jgi:hypothetical protein
LELTTEPEQGLVTTALYALAEVKFPVASVLDDCPETVVHVGVAAVQLVDICHTIIPALPVKVNVVPVPVQTVVLALNVPAAAGPLIT